MTTREAIAETVNKLFVYTDYQEWTKLMNEVFTTTVFLDMTSLGGEAKDTSSKTICQMWQDGFKDLDAINHLSGNYIIDVISQNEAKAFAYATATHYKASAKNGTTREFVGSYDIGFNLTEEGWRINRLVYNLKYMSGNLSLD